jgi:hypothetical protein
MRILGGLGELPQVPRARIHHEAEGLGLGKLLFPLAPGDERSEDEKYGQQVSYVCGQQ